MAEYDDKDLYGDYTYEDSETPANISALVGAFRNLMVNSAMIENLAVQDAHIQSVAANKIEAGEIQVDSNNLAFNALWKKSTLGWSLGTGVTRELPSFAFRGQYTVHSNQTGLTDPAWRGAQLLTDYIIPCQEGEDFTGSVYYWTPYTSSFTDGGIEDRHSIEVIWYKADKTRLSVNQKDMDTFFGNTAPTQPWRRVSLTAKAPAGAAYVGLSFWVRRNGRAYYAAPQLQRGKFLTEFTDNGTYIGPNGIMTTDLKFSGSLEGATGSFSGALSAATGTFAGELSSGTFTGVSGDLWRLEMRRKLETSPRLLIATGPYNATGEDALMYSPSANVVRWASANPTAATLRFEIDGHLYVQDVRITSTATEKTNIRPLDEEFDSLSLIDETIYTYHYRADVDALNFENKQVGLIAEGIHPILKGDNAQTINLYAVTSVLWDAVNKLKKRIEQLEALNAPY